jgi:hypothetical protein
VPLVPAGVLQEGGSLLLLCAAAVPVAAVVAATDTVLMFQAGSRPPVLQKQLQGVKPR